MKLVFYVFLLFAQISLAYPLIPDPLMTNGDLCTAENPDFAGYRYKERIPYCRRNVERETKTNIYMAYQIPLQCRNHYTIDHFIPLSMGGSNKVVNLWPEHKKVKATRPYLEQEVFEQLKKGEITQAEAIDIIVQAKTTVQKMLQVQESTMDCD